MSDSAFVVVPPRKVPGLDTSSSGVLSLNAIGGHITILPGDYIEIDTDGSARTVTVSLGSNDFALTTGDVFTGNLSFSIAPGAGKYGLRLHNQSSDPADPVALGAIYFNTADGVVRVYGNSGWEDVGPVDPGVLSIQAGFGLRADGVPFGTITSSGVLDLNLDADPTWTGDHTFTAPIVFASNQTFNAANLTLAGETPGMMLYRGVSAWQGLTVGASGQILTVSSGVPSWQDPSSAQWSKYTISYTSIAALLGSTGTVNIYLLPAGGFVHAVKIKHSTAFAGSGVSSLVASVGTATKPTYFLGDFDVIQAVAGDAMAHMFGLTTFSHTSSMQLVLGVECNTNLSNLSQGSVDVWLLTSVAV